MSESSLIGLVKLWHACTINDNDGRSLGASKFAQRKKWRNRASEDTCEKVKKGIREKSPSLLMALRETVGRTEKLNTTTNERSAEAAGRNFGIGGRI